MAFIAVWAALLLPLNPARAEEIPGNLLGHSIIISWSEQRAWQPADKVGLAHEDVVKGKATIYLVGPENISGQVQRTVSASKDGKNLGEKQFSNETASGKSKSWTWSFDHQTLNGYDVNTGGVQRLSISFHGRFGNCSIQSVYGKPNGERRFVTQGWNNDAYYLISNRLLSSSCAIYPGNALANPQ